MKLIQSYLLDKYFISTIYRKASTVEVMYFYETIVWEWDSIKKKRGQILDSHDSGSYVQKALVSHYHICLEISEKHNVVKKEKEFEESVC